MDALFNTETNKKKEGEKRKSHDIKNIDHKRKHTQKKNMELEEQGGRF